MQGKDLNFTTDEALSPKVKATWAILKAALGCSDDRPVVGKEVSKPS